MELDDQLGNSHDEIVAVGIQYPELFALDVHLEQVNPMRHFEHLPQGHGINPVRANPIAKDVDVIR
jgi:hypothetical protein